MKDFGYIRVAAATPRVWLADIDKNVDEICALIDEAAGKAVKLAAFPEMCVTGYTCGDLFGQRYFIDRAEDGVQKICRHTEGKDITVIVGAPVRLHSRLYNCAIVICDGDVRGIVPKTWMPTYGEFYESRWFTSARELPRGEQQFINYAGSFTEVRSDTLFSFGTGMFGVEICEDAWTTIPPSSYMALGGAQIIFNLSASNENIGKHEYRKSLLSSLSSREICGYVYASAGYGESTQDLVFGGSSMIYEYGSLMAENERFTSSSQLIISDIDIEKIDNLRAHANDFIQADATREFSIVPLSVGLQQPDYSKSFFRTVNAHPFVPQGDPAELDRRAREITSIQVQGLATRLGHINAKTAVVGISGGLDSTLALLITVLAFDKLGWDRKRILGVTMPGFGTTKRTHSNASDLMDELGITSMEVSIVPAVTQHFKDIDQDPSVHDLTYENSQARERTQLLMDIAGKNGGIVVGTGDLSELALGWATYNGDHMSMYGVNCSIPKTLVRSLVQWAAENRFKEAEATLRDIIDTPISPELIPADENGNIAQITEDLVGPYDLHDFFLYNFFRFGYSPAKIKFLAMKAFDGVFDEQTITKWEKTFLRRFFSQQFKRSCIPDGPKVGSVSLSPRGDWRMPSDASAEVWLADLD